MAKPPNYPNSFQTTSERIPTRFRKHVRHFLAAIDRLNTDFEVHCTLYQAGTLQPLSLLYTEEGAQTSETASPEDSLAADVTDSVVDSPGLETKEPVEQPASSPPTVAREAEAEPLLPVVEPPGLLQSEFGAAACVSCQTEPQEDSDATLIAADPTWDSAAAGMNSLQTDWESTLTGEHTASRLTGRRPPTLTEILQGTYSGHAQAVQQTETPTLSTQPGPCPTATPNPIPTVERHSDGFAAVVDEALESANSTAGTLVPPESEVDQGDSTALLLPAATAAVTQETPLVIESATHPTALTGEATLPTVDVDPSALEAEAPAASLTDGTLLTALSLVPEPQGPAAPVTDPLTTSLQGERVVETTPSAVKDKWTQVESTEGGTGTSPTPPAERERLIVEGSVQRAREVVTSLTHDSPFGVEREVPGDTAVMTDSDPPLDAAAHVVTGEPESLTGPPLLTATANPPLLASGSGSTVKAVPGDADSEASILPLSPPHAERDPDPPLSAAASEPDGAVLSSLSGACAIASVGGNEVDLPSLSEAMSTLVDEPSATGDNESALNDRRTVVVPSATGDREPALNGSTVPLLELPSDSVLLPTERESGGPTSPSWLTAECVSLFQAAVLNEALETGSETASPFLEGSDALLGTLPLTAWESASIHSQQAVIQGSTGTGADQTLRQPENLSDPDLAVKETVAETRLETALDTVNGKVQEGTITDISPVDTAHQEPSSVTFNSTPALSDEALTTPQTSTPALTHVAPLVASSSIFVPCSESPTEGLSSTPVALNDTPAPEQTSTNALNDAVMAASQSSTPALTEEPPTEGLSSSVAPVLDTATPLESGQQPDNNCPPTPEPTATALSTLQGVEPEAEALNEGQESELLETKPLPLETSAALDTSPTPLNEAPHITVETPDQSFAENLFVVWRRLALQQSPTVWGVVVNLEDLFTQGFSTWFAPRFIGSLAAAEGLMVTWGCIVQLVNEADGYQERERYQVGGKTVTGITFQSPNARITTLEPDNTVPSLKSFAQLPALLPSFSAEPVEAGIDNHESAAQLPGTNPPSLTDTPPSQWTDPADQTHTMSHAATLDEADEEDAPLIASRPRRRWRDGLRMLLGR